MLKYVNPILNGIEVLIVAECNVNRLIYFTHSCSTFVLIVAECNVNSFPSFLLSVIILVLIVAECNVNQYYS